VSDLIGVNMTNLFNRELFMYSLGDIHFKKPVSLKKVAYTTAFLICYSLPLVLIFGLQLNPFFFATTFIPPLLAGHYATKPVFGGKTLIEFVKTMILFMREPKGWTDLNANNHMGNEVFFVENEIWIGRRRELQLLADMKEKSLTNNG
jgi:hypothetical protein